MTATHTAITITHSDIATYLRCKRAWLWSYIHDYNKPDSLTGALALGSRVHLALEGLYRGIAEGEPINAVELHDALARADLETILARGGGWEEEQLYEDMIVGRNCVSTYVDWLATTGADDGFEVDGVEDMIEAPILDGRVLLRGKVDVRFRRVSDGALVLDDFKTTGLHFSQLRDKLERSYQLRIYRLIQKLARPEEVVAAARYTMIKKVSRRQHGAVMVERFHVPGVLSAEEMNRIHLEAICEDMIADAAKIGETDVERVFYPSPDESCKWCQFKNPCLVRDENPAAAGEMLEVQFTGGRHDRYEDPTFVDDKGVEQ